MIGEVSTWLQTFLRLVSDRVNNLESAQLRKKSTLFQLEKVLAYVIITRHFIEDLVSAVKLFPLTRLVLSEVSINERHRVELPGIFHLDFYRE